MTEDSPQKRGGEARAGKLSPERRSEIARIAAQERWSGGEALPKATHGSSERPLSIGDIQIPCYVLADGRRVISSSGVQSSMSIAAGGSMKKGVSRLELFIEGRSINPFVSKELSSRVRFPIRFKTKNGSNALGYEAQTLVDLCETMLKAREAGALYPQQLGIAHQCEILIRAFAKVGIVALVDEATGYQAERERNELHKLLEKYLTEERLAWAKRFPDEFYRQIYRLKGWAWPTGKGRTPLLGHITNDIVYDRLPEGVLGELQKRNPTNEESKRRQWKHHQFLSPDIGQPDLRDHLLQTIAVMRVSQDWESFKDAFDRAFPRSETVLE